MVGSLVLRVPCYPDKVYSFGNKELRLVILDFLGFICRMVHQPLTWASVISSLKWVMPLIIAIVCKYGFSISTLILAIITRKLKSSPTGGEANHSLLPFFGCLKKQVAGSKSQVSELLLGPHLLFVL